MRLIDNMNTEDIKPAFYLASGLWTLLVLAALVWHYFETRDDMLLVVHQTAVESVRKDMLYRRWAAERGGVYAPVSDKTPPNPYLLNVKERDIITPSGRKLTLINPAYMTRQVHELALDRSEISGHLTSLNPQNPRNAPDAWETDALRNIERGKAEVSGLALINGEEFYRLLQPMRIEAPCLKCHGAQGYRLGDLRGGISVSIPMKSTRVLFREQVVSDLLRLSVIWLVGLVAIIATTHFLRRRITEHKLLEQQLRQSQKMEAIGQFAGGVAHDFNNLLQVINTFGFLIEGQLKENSLLIHFVEEQRVAIKRATSLTKALLSFSRRQVSEPKRQDINQAVEEAHKLLRYITGKNVQLVVKLQPDELQVCIDEGQMYQVLMNLVVNARDAMPAGGQIVIATSRVNPDKAFRDRHGCNTAGDFALLSVTDTGHGMAQDCLVNIFEPFYTTKADGKGTGLGLSVSYGIIQQHQGIIEVESTPGEGTSFRIFLPLAG